MPNPKVERGNLEQSIVTPHVALSAATSEHISLAYFLQSVIPFQIKWMQKARYVLQPCIGRTIVLPTILHDCVEDRPLYRI